MGLLTPHGGMYSSLEGMLQLMQQQLTAYNVKKNNAKASSPLLSTQVSYTTGLYDGLDYGYDMFSATTELGLYHETVLWHGGDLDGFGSE
ncbi:hypothetical protein PSECIP111951_01612 [Pseudoalteromonas holothuriae]|uniref:Uncharacterized protein n=1 Tax=Pseudoalteromonas holothuriae TaxID=2963714 RepID=A0ABN8UK13_9GAMM|nr:hypothetical protein [Pseudoalteromonas sp. CIP111951]CAH9057171.1 hypothetical protein PSECIP111951_01612 [Pseudoalteromonas sp. CIP111951]